MKILLVLLTSLTFVVTSRIECDWATEFLCGDKCLGISERCGCGEHIFDSNHGHSVYCCQEPNTSCRKAWYGIDCKGQVLYKHHPCHGSCKQKARNGYTMLPCADQKECYEGIFACNGKPQCTDHSDLRNCADPKKTVNCTENWLRKDCGQLQDSKFQNYGCQLDDGKTGDYFECSNRNDKVDILFKNPPVPPKQKTFQVVNYNEVLNFTNNSFFCGQQEISWDDFGDHLKSNEKCLLKNGKNVTIIQLWVHLMTDFSFEMSPKLTKLYKTDRITQLRGTCVYFPDNNFKCHKSSSTFCIHTNQKCDGIANCPNGEDEFLAECNSTYSSLSTVECEKKNIFNVNITIKAVPCDGNPECQDGRDEYFCSLEDYIEIIILLAIIVIIMAVTIVMIRAIRKNCQPIDRNQTLTKEEFLSLHGTEELKIIMQQIQSCDSAKKINQQFASWEIDQHDGSTNETVLCIKNSLDSTTAAKVMSEFPSEKKTFFGQITKRAKNLIRYERISSKLETMTIFLMIKTAVRYAADLIKDILLAVVISLSQGGFTELIMQEEPYIRGIFFMFLGSIIIPWLLSSVQFIAQGPEALFGKKGCLQWFLLIMLAPVYPVFLVMKESILFDTSKTFVVSLKQLKDLQYQVGQYVRTDLGLESHCQLTLTFILVLLASSMTRTIVGFEVMFEKDTLFYLPTDVALALSISWSIVSSLSAFLKGISKKRKHSTAASNAIVLLYAAISIFMRTFIIVLFWTPCLGLMNCLRHLQGEMYPFLIPYWKQVNATTDKFYFGKADPILWNVITRWNYTGYEKAEPPRNTLYTIFSIEQYFTGFMVALMMNVIMQTAAKKWTNPAVYGKASWIDLGVHSISTTFIPHPLKEWDEDDGSVDSHRIRKDLVLREMLASILLNFGFNLMFLSPLIILAIHVFERQSMLLDSIGAFPEETEAFELVKLMLIIGYSFLVFLMICQIVLYYLYNGKYHPYNKIVMPDKKTFYYEEMKSFSHYECRQKHSIYPVFRALPQDVNKETQSAEENTPSKLEVETTMSATVPETTRIFSDIASFPDDTI